MLHALRMNFEDFIHLTKKTIFRLMTIFADLGTRLYNKIAHFPNLTDPHLTLITSSHTHHTLEAIGAKRKIPVFVSNTPCTQPLK